MPRFAANLSMMFTEHAFLDRFAAAKEAGFEAAEFLFPYDFDATEIRRAIDDAQLSLALFNAPPGDWDGGERGTSALPGQEAHFLEGLKMLGDYAGVLQPRHVHIMAGITDAPEAFETYVSNLRLATLAMPERSLLIEVINPINIPGYFMNRFETARDVIEAINMPNMHLQFDAFHAHRIYGDVVEQFNEYNDITAHVQIAGHPGRHEPDVGEIDYPAFFEVLDLSGYDGFVGCEYIPAADTVQGLGWFNQAR